LTASNSLNWVDAGAVTPPKSQGTCGTCWSFATVGMCESSLVLQGRAYNNFLSRIDLAEQYLLKCTSNSSCNGGYLETALDKALATGLPYESAYPYYPFSTSYDLNYGLCYTRDLVKISNMSRISKYNVGDDVIIGMLQDGPVTAAVGSTGWEYYSAGIYRCPGTVPVDHAVLIVGYTSDYWLLKNSWGTSFGEEGFIRITRDTSQNCRIGVAVHKMYQSAMSISILLVLLLLLALS
jgi:C1A family cysteine protease